MSIQRYVVQNYLVGVVSEIHVVHDDIAFKRRISHGAVAVRMLPRPRVGALRTFFYFSVFAGFCVYQRHVAVIFFGLLVDKVKYTACARLSHYDRVNLVGNLTQLVGKLTRHAEKCDYCRNFHYADERSCGEQRRETYIPCVVNPHSDYVRTADKRKYYVHYVAYIVNDRHQHIGKGVCFIRSFAQLRSLSVFIFFIASSS